MIGGGEKRNHQLAFELQNSHGCEKCSKTKFKHEIWFYLPLLVLLFFHALFYLLVSVLHQEYP